MTLTEQPSEVAQLRAQRDALLARQAASVAVLRAISATPGDPQPAFALIVRHMRDLAGASTASIFGYDGERLHRLADDGYTPEVLAALRAGFPRPAGPDFVPGRVVLANDVVQVADLTSEPGVFAPARGMGARSYLGIPLRREGQVVGVLGLGRADIGAFEAEAVALAQSFAEQAVIALENARLIAEQHEALEQQTATAEVLQVINASPGNLAPVFDAMLEKAMRLCEAAFGQLATFDGNRFHHAAAHGVPLAYAAYKSDHPPQYGPGTGPALLLAGAPIVHVADLKAEAVYQRGEPNRRALVDLGGARTSLVVPLRKEGTVLGCIQVYRQNVRPFSDKQIALLQNFAAQAVIAMENARLLTEQREALERQTATAEVLQVINANPGKLAPVFAVILEKAHAVCGAEVGALFLTEGEVARAAATHGYPAEIEAILRTPRAYTSISGRLQEWQLPVHRLDIREGAAPDSVDARLAAFGVRTSLAVPLREKARLVGYLTANRLSVKPYTAAEIALLESFAAQALIAMENARLLTEQREALERQTATAEVLQVINENPGNLAPVFATILEKAHALCGAAMGCFFLFDGDVVKGVATRGYAPEIDAVLRRPHPAQAIGQRLRDGTRYIHNHDVKASTQTPTNPISRAIRDMSPVRTNLLLPLRTDGALVGVISANRPEVRPYTEAEIALLESFAAQAVIAVENARLLTELRARTEELGIQNTHQAATIDVLKVMSSASSDTQPVFDIILRRAVELCEAMFGGVFEIVDGMVHIRGIIGWGEAETNAYVKLYPRPISSEWLMDRAMLAGRVDYIPNILKARPDAPQQVRDLGFLSQITVPLMRDGSAAGGLLLLHRADAAFTEAQVALLKTFAEQAVIAMTSAATFGALQARTSDLAEALEQQTAAGYILRIINRSPSDVTPVFDAIAERARVLCGALLGATTRFDGKLLHLIGYHGVSPAAEAIMRSSFPRAPDLSSINGRCILARAPVQIADIATDPHYQLMAAATAANYRALLAVPMLRNEAVIGVIAVTREEPGAFSAKLIELLQTFADQAVIAIQNADLFNEAQLRAKELSASLDNLRLAQDRLVQTEKLASLGQLTAGIAHEIKNPLNFVNNFAELSAELLGELEAAVAAGDAEELAEISTMLRDNLAKIAQHGKRADSIVRNMLQHSRSGTSEARLVDLNALAEEALKLAYHGARAAEPGFNITLEQTFDPAVGEVELFPQEITRVLLNLIGNGFYAARKRAARPAGDEPSLHLATRDLGGQVEIRVRDNGTGMTDAVRERIFEPFFTTKPTGEGTGLGLSLSHDIIVKQHGGQIEVASEVGNFTEFAIRLPRRLIQNEGVTA